MTTHIPAQLTSDEVAALQAVREGHKPAADAPIGSLIEKGYLTRDGDTLIVAQDGDDHLNMLPNYGEALVDILLPGVGTAEAAKRDVPGDDAAPAARQTKP